MPMSFKKNKKTAKKNKLVFLKWLCTVLFTFKILAHSLICVLPCKANYTSPQFDSKTKNTDPSLLWLGVCQAHTKERKMNARQCKVLTKINDKCACVLVELTGWLLQSHRSDVGQPVQECWEPFCHHRQRNVAEKKNTQRHHLTYHFTANEP